MTGMVLYARGLDDDCRDTIEGPQGRFVTLGLGTFEEGLDQLLELLLGKPTARTGQTDFVKSFDAFCLPPLIPAAGTLAADVQATGDLRIGEVLLKEFRCLQAALLVTFIAFDRWCVHNTYRYEFRNGPLPYRAELNR